MKQSWNDRFLALVNGWDGTPFRMAVVGDTHVPDRMGRLHPQLLDEVDRQKPDGIVHTGDCSTTAVLHQFAEIAPVLAVRGNRDWFVEGQLPTCESFEILGQRVSCTHGHGSLFHYLIEKVKYFTIGYQQNHYTEMLRQKFPNSRLIIFGHSHTCLNEWSGCQLFFNPGSSVHVPNPKCGRTYGMVEITPGGNIVAALYPLTGWKRNGREWVQV